ncbi:unnamed protein product [Ectocarpus sp. CCAP 1310/34]|nr:unnamed protein product [Ectocarpus sp. CCAP 1310/34]
MRCAILAPITGAYIGPKVYLKDKDGSVLVTTDKASLDNCTAMAAAAAVLGTPQSTPKQLKNYAMNTVSGRRSDFMSAQRRATREALHGLVDIIRDGRCVPPFLEGEPDPESGPEEIVNGISYLVVDRNCTEAEKVDQIEGNEQEGDGDESGHDREGQQQVEGNGEEGNEQVDGNGGQSGDQGSDLESGQDKEADSQEGNKFTRTADLTFHSVPCSFSPCMMSYPSPLFFLLLCDEVVLQETFFISLHRGSPGGAV